MTAANPAAAVRPELSALLAELQAILGERLTTSAAIREHHGKDESYLPYAAPDAVAYPESTDEVRRIVLACRAKRVPIIPFGVGTSLEGHILATRGGICVDMSRMNRIVAVHEQDLDVVVEAGVTRKQLNEAIKHQGLFFPIDPGADATLGGMTATRASGTNAVRYGTMRENVLSLKVVLADGRVIQTARRARKSSAGYDLTRLFVGSEGTLGIITEITLRLQPVQAAISAATCAFPSVEAAAKTVIEILQCGIPVARSELLDALTMKALNRYSKMSHREAPTLLLEFHGSEAAVVEQAKQVQELARDNGGLDFQWATQPEQRSKLWEARHNAYFAALQLKPGSRAISTDVCVPISRLAECIAATAEDISHASMPIPLFGHVGDGNFHLVILIDPASQADLEEAKAINQRVVRRALAMEGTCTGEHGVGIGKQHWLREELGDAVDLMLTLKRSFDPENLLNPGKLVDIG
jgi:D-lactate dehydrogenase (cytochrome)